MRSLENDTRLDWISVLPSFFFTFLSALFVIDPAGPLVCDTWPKARRWLALSDVTRSFGRNPWRDGLCSRRQLRRRRRRRLARRRALVRRRPLLVAVGVDSVESDGQVGVVRRPVGLWLGGSFLSFGAGGRRRRWRGFHAGRRDADADGGWDRRRHRRRRSDRGLPAVSGTAPASGRDAGRAGRADAGGADPPAAAAALVVAAAPGAAAALGVAATADVVGQRAGVAADRQRRWPRRRGVATPRSPQRRLDEDAGARLDVGHGRNPQSSAQSLPALRCCYAPTSTPKVFSSVLESNHCVLLFSHLQFFDLSLVLFFAVFQTWRWFLKWRTNYPIFVWFTLVSFYWASTWL